jgi:hypothetical protein
MPRDDVKGKLTVCEIAGFNQLLTEIKSHVNFQNSITMAYRFVASAMLRLGSFSIL